MASKEINLDDDIDIDDDIDLDAFPFSKDDFKGGALDNKQIKETFLEIINDIELTGGKRLDDASLLVTPPRGQQEIVLRFLKEQLINNEADKKIINHITTLQNNLSKKIKESGYYGAGAEVEERITNLPGYVKNLIKKRKSNASGGRIGFQDHGTGKASGL